MYLCTALHTSFSLRSKRSLVLHECLSQFQQLSVLLGVHPPQVLHMLDHHLHSLTNTTLLTFKYIKTPLKYQNQSHLNHTTLQFGLMLSQPGIKMEFSSYFHHTAETNVSSLLPTWWIAPSISERLDTLVMDWMRISRFFWSLWMISMDWLSTSHRGIKALEKRLGRGKNYKRDDV